MFWNTGDEEHSDERFRAAGLDGCGLYVMAGSWSLGDVRGKRGPLPEVWFVPDWFVRSWPNGNKAAKRLVDAGLWKPVNGGYEYVWILGGNTPEAAARLRKKWRDDKRGGQEP